MYGSLTALPSERLPGSQSLTHVPRAAHLSAFWGHQSSLQAIAFFGAFCNMTEKRETLESPGEPYVTVTGNGSRPSESQRGISNWNYPAGMRWPQALQAAGSPR